MSEPCQPMQINQEREPYPEEYRVVETQSRMHVYDALERSGIPQNGGGGKTTGRQSG